MKICRRPSDLVHAAPLSEERITTCDEVIRAYAVMDYCAEMRRVPSRSHGWRRPAVANSLRTIAEALNTRGVPTARAGAGRP